jgi:hypothetical protein
MDEWVARSAGITRSASLAKQLPINSNNIVSGNKKEILFVFFVFWYINKTPQAICCGTL